jgi:16S rRNA (cytosine967-C5)-methyltransferase
MVLSSAEASKPAASRGSDPRLQAARILQEVLQGRSLSDALPRHLSKCKDSRDRSLIQELCYGVMRWLPRLERLAEALLKKPLKTKDQDVYALVLIGLYQLLYLRVADHAAVYQTAGAAERLRKRWAVGLINGILREFQRRQDALLRHIGQDPVARYAIPEWLLIRLQQIWPDRWRERVAALNGRPPMCLRVNRLHGGREDYLAYLQEEGIEATAIGETHSGVLLARPLDVSVLPGFSEGRVSVQDGGAQLAAESLQLQPGQQVLDACAAPGGKTGHILESAQPLLVTAVDRDQVRLQQVSENLQRLGLRADILRGDASEPAGRWAETRYDRILLDVPCSATGVIRRHPDIKYLRRPEDIEPLVELQGRILRRIWPLLKPGGLLLYATCSLLPEENEWQVARFLTQQGDAQESVIEAAWGEACSVGRQIPPGMHHMDGFYYARLEKCAV